MKAFAERASGSFVALEDTNHVTAFVDVDAVAAAVDEHLRVPTLARRGREG